MIPATIAAQRIDADRASPALSHEAIFNSDTIPSLSGKVGDCAHPGRRVRSPPQMRVGIHEGDCIRRRTPLCLRWVSREYSAERHQTRPEPEAWEKTTTGSRFSSYCRLNGSHIS